MGQQSGGVDPGSYANTPGCQVPSQPSQQDVSHVYDQYGMHHYDMAQTLDQLQAKVQALGQADYGLFAALLAVVRLLTEPQSMLDAQAERLAKAQGLKRSAPGAPAVNYLGLSHQELYDAVQQAQPDQVGKVGATWTELGNALAKIPDELAKGIANSESGWTGAGAQKARKAVARIGNHAGEAGQGVQLAGTMIERQAASLSTARVNVPKPPAKPFDPQAAAAHLQTITDPVARAKQAHADAQQQAQEKAAHQQAAQAVQTYDQTSTQIASSQPAFAPTPPPARPGGGGDVTGGISPSPTIHAGDGGGPSYSGGGPDGGPGHSAGPTVPGSGSGSHHTGGSGAGGGQAGGPDSPGGGYGQTTTSSASGYGSGGPGGAGGGYGESAYGGSRYGAGPGASAGGFGGVGGAALGGVSGEFDGGNGVSRSGGFGGFGSGSGAGGPTARGGATGAGAESGARSGAGASAAESSAASRGAGGARGGAGMGMAPPGGRGGKGGEDNEHQTASYLQEPDTDEIFGTDERTAPPVIGDWFADG